jgi:hypothetical protein
MSQDPVAVTAAWLTSPAAEPSRAIAARDPLLALMAERERLLELARRTVGHESDTFVEQAAAIEEQICETRATAAAGLFVHPALLREHAEVIVSGSDCYDTLLETTVAGVKEMVARTGGRAAICAKRRLPPPHFSKISAKSQRSVTRL